MSSRNKVTLCFFLMLSLLFVSSCSNADTEKQVTKFTAKEEAVMGHLSMIRMSFESYRTFIKKEYPNAESGQNIIGQEMLKMFFKEELLGPKHEHLAKLGLNLEQGFEKYGYNSYMSWNLTKEQWQLAEKFKAPHDKKWVDFPLAWNTIPYNGKVCYVTLQGIGKYWLPEEEFKEYLKFVKNWIESEPKQ